MITLYLPFLAASRSLFLEYLFSFSVHTFLIFDFDDGYDIYKGMFGVKRSECFGLVY